MFSFYLTIIQIMQRKIAIRSDAKPRFQKKRYLPFALSKLQLMLNYKLKYYKQMNQMRITVWEWMYCTFSYREQRERKSCCSCLFSVYIFCTLLPSVEMKESVSIEHPRVFSPFHFLYEFHTYNPKYFLYPLGLDRMKLYSIFLE